MKTNYTLLFALLISLSGYVQGQTSRKIQASTLNTPLSVSKQVFSVDKIYPNPVKDFVTIDIQSKIAEPVSITLYNILGTEVKKWDASDLHEGNQQLRLDLSEIKSGVYIFKFSVSDQIFSQVVKKN